MINIICAVDQDGAIGFQNHLLFRLSADLKRFRQLTTGHVVVMGRRTFESLPKGALPNRRNLVLTRNAQFSVPNIEVFPNLKEAVDACSPAEEVFIIGGASVYREACPLAQRMYLTEVHARATEADVYFPKFDLSEWEETEREEYDADEKNEAPFAFVTYVRK